MLQGGWWIESKFPYTCVNLRKRDLIEPITAFLSPISHSSLS